MRNQNRLFKKFFLPLFLVGLLSLAPAGAFAQASKTADRSAEFDAFGGFTYQNDSYYSPTNLGGTLGGDYTQFIKRYHGLITPSFQIRGTLTPGSNDSEKTIEGGLKLATTYKRLHPYGDFLFGNGIINFPRPAGLAATATYRSHDSSFIYVYGGGLTYDIKPHWSAMVDFQQQYWDFGNALHAPPDRFYPQAITFGVVYHIPFKAYRTY
jgi:hypothetical protein